MQKFSKPSKGFAMDIKFVKYKDHAVAPVYATEGSAGCDLRACLKQEKTIAPAEIAIIDTGIGVEIPSGFFGMICSRSGMALKYGVVVLNSPGIIDPDYRGEIRCILINHSSIPFVVENGMRIAQMIIVPFQSAKWIEEVGLSESGRGSGGFGSTGI
ncbi:MAG: dUTP diphosphatase [Holosporales bacterium]|jgi:dUTP pyrophosphatase|nr:dUTP diphosphatase [Holosporales bacterium]